MTHYSKEREVFLYHKDEDTVEVKETNEEIRAMSIEKVRSRIKYYVKKYSESEWQKMKKDVE